MGIPSLPFAHIYLCNPEHYREQPQDESHAQSAAAAAGSGDGTTTLLVEELKINKLAFAEFERILRSYVEGECPMVYDDDDDDDDA